MFTLLRMFRKTPEAPAPPLCNTCGSTNSQLCSSSYHVFRDDNGHLLPNSPKGSNQ